MVSTDLDQFYVNFGVPMGIKPPIGIKAGWQPLRSMYMCSFWYCLNIGEISAVAKVHLITKIILIWIKAAYTEY